MDGNGPGAASGGFLAGLLRSSTRLESIQLETTDAETQECVAMLRFTDNGVGTEARKVRIFLNSLGDHGGARMISELFDNCCLKELKVVHHEDAHELGASESLVPDTSLPGQQGDGPDRTRQGTTRTK
eukprot:TRINITY_DN21771_c0_g1_i2.p2 TRINITY_DN21771_c0_g1~~TRINITY_DN21771_c0_g1_i2.p2  ORF type:complete len:128 (+),score=15.82 TRINITY_DN21771_c0_g1_i2:210-593(+)